jgi:hypothetical protein
MAKTTTTSYQYEVAPYKPFSSSVRPPAAVDLWPLASTSTSGSETVISTVLFFLHFSVNASLSTLARPVVRLAMPAGNSTASSMASSLTDTCRLTSRWEVMTPSAPSLPRPVRESTCQGQSSLTWNRQSLVSALDKEGDECCIPTRGSL